MNTWRERLQEALTESGLTRSELASRIDINPASITDWFNGKTKNMKAENAYTAAQHLGISLGWLLFGKGEKHNEKLNLITEVSIPKSSTIASMGLGDINNHSERIDWVTISLDWAKNKKLALTKPENLALIEGRGSSMEGIYNHGDVLIVDRGSKNIEDGIYVFNFEGETWIKTLQRLPGGTINAISNNKAFDSFSINSANGNSFEVLGRVVWVWNGKLL